MARKCSRMVSSYGSGASITRRVPTPAELRRIAVPGEEPEELQLSLDDAVLSMKDAAETDLPEVAESENLEESSESNEVVDPEGTPPAAI